MPTPNHKAAKGTQAIGAMKRKPSNSGCDDIVEPAEPAHQQAERHADEGRQQHAIGIALEARGQMLRQRRAGEGVVSR